MLEFSGSLICGLMVGIEAVTALPEIDEDIEWAITVDFFIFRFGVIKWKVAQ